MGLREGKPTRGPDQRNGPKMKQDTHTHISLGLIWAPKKGPMNPKKGKRNKREREREEINGSTKHKGLVSFREGNTK